MKTTKIVITVAAIALMTILLPTPASADRHRGYYHGYRGRPYYYPVVAYPRHVVVGQPIYYGQPVYYVNQPVAVSQPVFVAPQPVYPVGISFGFRIR